MAHFLSERSPLERRVCCSTGGEEGMSRCSWREPPAPSPSLRPLRLVIAVPSLSRLRLCCRQFHIPSEAEEGQRADDPVANVGLPPAQAVPGRGRESVVGV